MVWLPYQQQIPIWRYHVFVWNVAKRKPWHQIKTVLFQQCGEFHIGRSGCFQSLFTCWLIAFSVNRMYSEKPCCCVTSSEHVNVRANYLVNIYRWFAATQSALVICIYERRSRSRRPMCFTNNPCGTHIKNLFQNIVCEMATILSRERWINNLRIYCFDIKRDYKYMLFFITN